MPELKDGYTRIANELLEALAQIRIPGEACQMLRVIIRKTYGYQKKEAKISTLEFMNLTKLKRHAVHKMRKKLSDMNIITVTQKGDSQVLTYSIQKSYDKWQLSPKKVTVTQLGHRCNPKRSRTVTQKGDTYYIKKERNSLKKAPDHFKSLWERYPNKLVKSKAEKKYLATVKTEKDEKDIETALMNYLLYTKKFDKKFIKHGSTWFGEWKDWVDYKPETGGLEKWMAKKS